MVVASHLNSTLRPPPPYSLWPAPPRPLTVTNPSLTEATARYSPVQYKPAPAPDLARSFLPRKPISTASKAVEGRATPCPDAVPSSVVTSTANESYESYESLAALVPRSISFILPSPAMKQTGR